MNRWNSAFLDVVRLGAALLVFLGHLNYDYLIGPFWGGISFSRFGMDAVIVFFVLSGFVISHVVKVKENSPSIYLSTRVSRLLSISLPALFITIICDQIGLQFNPDFYAHAWWYQDDHWIFRFVSNFFLINQLWFLDIRPFSNGPFWSLGYEIWFYIFFAGYVFSGSRRWLVTIVLFILAGPRVLILYPLWLLGVHLYNKCNDFDIGIFASVLLAFIPIVLWCYFRLYGTDDLITHAVFGNYYEGSKRLLGRSYNFLDAYLVGVLVYCHFFGVSNLLKKLPDRLIPNRIYQSIRYLASGTFAIYATHYPIIHLIAAINPYGKNYYLVFIPLLVAFLVTSIGERFRMKIYNLLLLRSLENLSFVKNLLRGNFK